MTYLVTATSSWVCSQHGMFLLLQCDLQGILSMGLMVLVSSSTELVSRKSLVVMMYHGEYLLASQLRIPSYGTLVDTWVGLMYL
jgi:hypothetical protein